MVQVGGDPVVGRSADPFFLSNPESIFMKLLKHVALVSGLSAVLLAGCGGGGDGGAGTPVLSGVAAVGAPIVGGTVSVTCAGGSAMSATTLATGAWQVTTSGQTLPCAVRVTGGTVGGAANNTPYHSIAINFGTVNITPLTDLIVANLGGATPATWFGGINASTLQAITPARISAALQMVSDALGMTATLSGANPLTTAFAATNGELLDDVLEALAAAGASHQALLALAVNPNFTAPNGFDFLSAYATVVVNSGGGGGGTGTVRVAVSVSGQPATTFDVGGVDAPANQSEFCSDLASDPVFTDLGTSGGGSLTVNSCSYSGNVGTVNATLSLTGQPVTLPYTVTFTFL